MPISYLRDSGYRLGMIRDLPSWEIPPGGVYDSLNMVYDKPGIARQRGGTTALFSGNQTAFCTSLGFVYSQDATPIEELYGLDGKAGTLNLINKSTGSASALATPAPTNQIVGRPVRHFGFLVFPLSGRTILGVAGQTSATTFTNTALASVTAGNQQVTLTGADTTTNVKVGAVVKITDTPQTYHYARVVSVDTAKLFTIWPAPAWTSATVPIGNLVLAPAYGITGGGTCAASFQNRLLLGNTTDHNSVGQTLVMDRRIYYSPLPTEFTPVPTPMFVAATLAGASFLDPRLWPALNYFDVPGADPIVAMEPVDDNQLLILTSNQPVLFRGDLVTELGTTSPTITWDESAIMQPAGCLSDLSVARTPRGIVWAGAGGVYAYSGGTRIDDLTGSEANPRINTYWRNLSSDATLVIHGAAYVRNHYVISGTSGGTTFSLACNMTNLQWTRLSGTGTDIFLGAARPTNPGQVFAARWWDQTGAAPTMTNGQTVRLESMLAPYVAGAAKTDSDGAAVTVSLTTRTITGDADLQKMFQRGTIEYQQTSTTAATTVTAQSKIDAADISAASVRTLGSLSNTGVLTVISATNANPIVVTTTPNHGYQSDDFVDIDGVTGNTNANGRWRIAVTGVSTFSLVGGIGNGASGGSPTCKKLTETTFLMTPLNKGQGASVKFDGAPSNLEIHAIKLGVLQQEPSTV